MPGLLLWLLLPLLELVEQGAHLLVQQVHRLQWPHHDLEVDDLAGVVPADQVDAIDQDAVDLGGKFKHRVALADDLALVAEAGVVQEVHRAHQVLKADGLAALRHLHHRQAKGHFVGQQAVMRWPWIAEFRIRCDLFRSLVRGGV